MNAIETRCGTRIGSPKELEQLLIKYPLDKDFIDWVAAEKWTIHYNDYYNHKAWLGKLDHKFGLIMVNPNQTENELDITLVHELIHIAVPDTSWYRYRIERKIDKIARNYIKNKDFMGYFKQTMPIIKGPLFDNH